MKGVWISGVESKYPASLLDGRLNAEASTIGLIWQDPLILDETKLSEPTAEEFCKYLSQHPECVRVLESVETTKISE